MRFISTRVHGMLDYLLGIVLLVAPWLLDFSENDTATWVTVALGAAIILYSLLTDYELGVVRAIPMQMHLGLDFVSGLVLAASPWLFGFDETVWVPHLILGIFEIGTALMTYRAPTRMRTDIRERRTA